MTTRLPAAAAAVALSLALAPAALAQGTLTGTQALDDRLDDLETAVRDDLARGEDAARFANPEFRPGLSGSASLGYSAKTGNQDTQEFTLGTRLRYAQGNFVNSIGMAIDFAEAGGTKTKEDIFGVYEAQYYLNPQFYGFAIGRVAKDGLATTAAQTRTDAFWGVGPGFRVVNTPDMAWRVQAGIGQSYLRDGTGVSVTETGTIASSRFYWKMSDAVFVTNDTDVLKSKSALRANNDLGVNFKVTDRMATRVSYLTEYNDSRARRTDNKLGVSLVFGF
ncbi:MAG TPA: DUF481 domain-containing protein [Paracoccaceae bacterium]|nr:DUF481 domain-containing protein [Paracoccaceae bacterium]HMO71954.1 DUF481 domain-containing protein [Paracoccaceae bacterium]